MSFSVHCIDPPGMSRFPRVESFLLMHSGLDAPWPSHITRLYLQLLGGVNMITRMQMATLAMH